MERTTVNETNASALLEVRDIRKSFGSTQVLKGISFDLHKGEVLSIIGPSGGGKSTLLRCLNFLETPENGTISVNGETLFDASVRMSKKESDLRTKRLHFGLVFQSFNLFPHYNALENVALAPRLLYGEQNKDRLREVKKAGRRAVAEKRRLLFKEWNARLGKENVFGLWRRLSADMTSFIRRRQLDESPEAASLLARVGLADKMYNYPCELSGGQQQRVAIARALALHPDILCFDEPTSALDPELTGEVLRVIRDLKNEGTTMIIVTHEMEFARNVSDKVIFVSGGVIEEEGDPEDVFGSPQSEKTRSFLSRMEEKI